MSTSEPFKTVRAFLEGAPPSDSYTAVSDLGAQEYSSGIAFSAPDILLFCDSEDCRGYRLFNCQTNDFRMNPKQVVQRFVTYACKNCSVKRKTFALRVLLSDDGVAGLMCKYGELPSFGPHTPARLISLIGPQKDLFLKGRRSESQGLGIASFAYYRRIIEDQKSRIFDQIIRVCNRLGTDTELVKELEAAKEETQFSKAIATIKHGLPQALLVDGHNPLTLLHSALSEGMHAQSDEDCLELATSIRVVLADFIERVSQVLRDEKELATAVSRLMTKKLK